MHNYNNISVATQIQNAIYWIETLQTTQLPQGVGKLGHAQVGFCCLGLGCHILDIAYNMTEDTTSRAFADSVGLIDTEGSAFQQPSSFCLTALNDTYRYNF